MDLCIFVRGPNKIIIIIKDSVLIDFIWMVKDLLLVKVPTQNQIDRTLKRLWR